MRKTEKKKAEEECKSWKRKNTKLLLGNYRMLKGTLRENSIYKTSQLEDMEADIEQLMSQSDSEDMIIRSIKQFASLITCGGGDM